MIFDFNIVKLPIRKFMTLATDKIFKQSTDFNGMSQPCSWHFTDVKVRGSIFSERIGKYYFPVQIEHQQAFGLDPLSIQLCQHWEEITGLNSGIWTPKYAFWAFRNAMACFRCSQSGRIVKLIQPYRKPNWQAVQLVRDHWSPEPKIRTCEYIKEQWEKLISWDLETYLKEANPTIRDKPAGHPAARFLNRVFKLDSSDIRAIAEEDVTQNRTSSFDISSDRGPRWTYRLVHRILTSNLVPSSTKYILWTWISRWYNEMFPVIIKYEDLVIKAIQERKPDRWEDNVITAVLPTDVCNFRTGMRDSGDCVGLSMDFKSNNYMCTMKGADHRIVSATIDSGVAIAGSKEIITILEERCKHPSFTLKAYLNAMHCESGMDLSNADSFTGAVENQVAYVDSSDIVVCIPQGTGQLTTGFDNSDVGWTLMEVLNMVQKIIGIMGDDIACKKRDDADSIIAVAHKLLRMTYPLFKRKQCDKTERQSNDASRKIKPDGWINFILGLTRSHDYLSMAENGYARSVKFLSTKQSPSGSSRFTRVWENRKSKFEQLDSPWPYGFREHLGRFTRPFSSMAAEKHKKLFFGYKIDEFIQLLESPETIEYLMELIKNEGDIPESLQVIAEMGGLHV